MTGSARALIALALSAMLIAVGIAQGQAKQTASRAQRICLECVGFD